jgi:hypothetical protein
MLTGLKSLNTQNNSMNDDDGGGEGEGENH